MEEKPAKKVNFKAKARKQKGEQFKKFVGNKQEGQGFADKRKRKIQHEYRKMLHKEQKSAAAMGAGPSNSSGSKPTFHGKPHFRKTEKLPLKGQHTLSKASEKNKQKKERKKQKKKEALEAIEVRKSAMNDYQKRKKENYKKICKRTSKGQPIMKNQMEYLLQKIEKQVNQT